MDTPVLNYNGLPVLVFVGIAGGMAALTIAHGSIFDGVRAWLRGKLKCAQADLEGGKRTFRNRVRVFVCWALNTWAQCPYCVNNCTATAAVAIVAACLNSVILPPTGAAYGWLLWLFFKGVEVGVMLFIGVLTYGVVLFLEDRRNRERAQAALLRTQAAERWVELKRLETELPAGAAPEPPLSKRVLGKKSGEPAPHPTCFG